MINILLIEDDMDVRLNIEDVLFGEGYHLDVTTTVTDALSLLDTQRYDLFLTDGQLPDGTGLIIAQKAKKKGTKVLLFTGSAEVFSENELTRYAVLLKPAKITDLVQAVARVMNA